MEHSWVHSDLVYPRTAYPLSPRDLFYQEIGYSPHYSQRFCILVDGKVTDYQRLAIYIVTFSPSC
jgi:hypothetical protein